MARSIRVLNCVFDPRLGGPQQRAKLIAEGLRAETEIETEFLLPTGKGKFPERLKEDGYRVHRVPHSKIRPPRYVKSNIKYTVGFPRTIRLIIDVIRDRNIDLLHVNSPMNFHSALAGKFSDAQVIWHFNGYNFPDPLLSFIKISSPVLADELLFSSSIIREEIFDQQADYWTIFPPVDTEAFKQDIDTPMGGLRSELGIDSKTSILGTIGNIHPAKDHKLLLHAVRRVIDSYGEIAVPVIGRMPASKDQYISELKSLCTELNLDEYVHFLGWRDNTKKLLSQFDAFVLSSKMETGPMALMEAMAMELPFVTTEVGVVNDVPEIKSIGWVTEPEDVSAFTQSIIDCLNSQDNWEATGKRARQSAKSQFSIGESVNRHRDLYNSAAESCR